MKPVSWGVISTADIAIAKVLPAMMKANNLRISAIASRDLGKAKEAAGRLAIPKAYGSYEELLADPEIEAVYNPLPNHLHVGWSIKALEAGKHVLCEKPIALNAEEVLDLVAARDRTGKLVEEAFMVRSSPQWLRAGEIVSSGRIGELRLFQGAFSYFNDDPRNVRNQKDIGGGGILDIGCYHVMTARTMFGAEPTRVVAVLDRDPRFGTDRLASALMEFPGGGQATWFCSTQLVPCQWVQLFGTRGRIEIEIAFNPPNDRENRIVIDDGRDLDGGGIVVETVPLNDQYTVQGELFSRAVRGDGEPVVSLEDSLANMRVIDALFESERSGGWVSVPGR